jgi:hypothetical protein
MWLSKPLLYLIFIEQLRERPWKLFAYSGVRYLWFPPGIVLPRQELKDAVVRLTSKPTSEFAEENSQDDSLPISR